MKKLLVVLAFLVAACDTKSATEPKDNDSRLRASAFCYTTTTLGVRPLPDVSVTLKSDIPFKVETLRSTLDGWTNEVEWVAKLDLKGNPMYDDRGRPVPPDRFFVDARYAGGAGAEYEPFSEYLIPFVGYDQGKPKDTIIVFDIELQGKGGIGKAERAETLKALRLRYPDVAWKG